MIILKVKRNEKHNDTNSKYRGDVVAFSNAGHPNWPTSISATQEETQRLAEGNEKEQPEAIFLGKKEKMIMQIKNEDYNPELHLKIRCLCVRQPYADLLTQTPWRDENGIWRAEKTIEVRSRKTKFRGDVLICASRQPEIPGHITGCAVGFVEIYDIKPISEFTEDDWTATCIPENERANHKAGFGWLVRNPRRIVEMPVVGKLGFFDIVVPKDDLTEYPRAMALGKSGWEIVKRKIRKGNGK